MHVDEVQKRLEHAGLAIEKKERTPNGKAWQLKCKSGEGCCVYDTGSVVPEGKNQENLREILGLGKPAEKAAEAARQVSRRIFVVYGHDRETRTQLEAM